MDGYSSLQGAICTSVVVSDSGLGHPPMACPGSRVTEAETAAWGAPSGACHPIRDGRRPNSGGVYCIINQRGGPSDSHGWTGEATIEGNDDDGSC